MARLGAEIDGMSSTLDKLEDVVEEAEEALAGVLNRSAERGKDGAESALDRKTSPYGLGAARATIRVQKEAEARDLEAIVAAGGAATVRAGFDYTLSIEFGAKPHFPPVEKLTGKKEALDEWVQRMNPTGDVEDVAFSIAQDISRRGLDERPFMRPGFRVAKADIRKRVKTVKVFE